MLTAMGSLLSWLMCQNSTHCCICEPIIETIRPTQISVKRRWRRAGGIRSMTDEFVVLIAGLGAAAGRLTVGAQGGGASENSLRRDRPAGMEAVCARDTALSLAQRAVSRQPAGQADGWFVPAACLLLP